MALQWTSTLSVGVPELDEQHKELFRRIDRLLDAMLHQDRSEAGRLLAFLRDYATEHFAAEERLMAEVGYPDAERHIEEHRVFAKELATLDAEFVTRGATASVVFRLERQAVGWLQDHVYFTDVALGRFVHARQASARPRAAC
jgi:hemerythrin